MPDLLAVSTMKAVSGFPEDSVVNTLAISAPSGFDAATHGPAFRNAWRDFFNVANPASGIDIASRIGKSVSRAVDGIEFDLYDITGHLDGSPHGSPVWSGAWTLNADSGTQNLPREIAIALTLRGTSWQTQPVETPDDADPGIEPQRPRQRHTGRIYLGPWRLQAVQNEVTPYEARPSVVLMDDLLNRAGVFADALDAALAGTVWCIWSRSMTFLHTVTHVQVDNAFDVIRKRGADPTVRNTLAL